MANVVIQNQILKIFEDKIFKNFNLMLNTTSNNTPPQFAVVMAMNVNKYRAGDTQKPDKPDSMREPERRKNRQHAEDALNRLENPA